ncbi:hypothetical protein [Mycobacterium leprae]|uniref:hypothetical protein n=1 Tax=Mycobacterium leprae TaxID=1769 RepID=UPI00031F2E36|nr:hypothetical protein [Mycobacterium leprae]
MVENRAFFSDQNATTMLAMTAEVLAAIGRVPTHVLADRISCLKGRVVASIVVSTTQYV